MTRPRLPALLAAGVLVLVGVNIASAHEPNAKTGPAEGGRQRATDGPAASQGADEASGTSPRVGGASTHSLAWWRNRARHNRRAYRHEHARYLAEKAHRLRDTRTRARTLQAHEPQTTVWDTLIRCEAAGYGWPLLTTGNGFYFAVQFTETTWDSHRGSLPTVRAYLAASAPPSREEQIVVAERVLAEQGWNAWPTCSRNMGLR